MEKYTIFNFGLLHLEWTNALFVLVVFSLLVISLHFLLFKPVLRTIINRENNKGSFEAEIVQLKNEKDKVDSTIWRIQEESVQELSAHRAHQLRNKKQELDEMINESKQKLEEKNKITRQEYQADLRNIEENTESLVDGMVEDLKNKIA